MAPSELSDRLSKFSIWVDQNLIGDEKGEGQVFLDRFFQAMGHDGLIEAGATLEARQRRHRRVHFIDLLWPGHVLVEMKKRGQKLQKHYQQAFEYWAGAVPHRPRFVILCNFDEFWIYDFDNQLYEPVEKLQLADLSKRHAALHFLTPEPSEPVFGNDRVAVTRSAADSVAEVFNSLVGRGIAREVAQRFTLQSIFCMFAEDIELLPKALFTKLLTRSADEGESTYDLLAGLFHQMDRKKNAKSGSFQNVGYFNGGLFSEPEPLELEQAELTALLKAAKHDWSAVNPAIFGTILEHSMGGVRRHALGAHFTSEADILRVVEPTIVRPLRDRISAASTGKELLAIRNDLRSFRVLDPACGSGNFLYVAFRELRRLELDLLTRIHSEYSKKIAKSAGWTSYISPHNFFGIDRHEFAVELTKVSLLLAKVLSRRERLAYLKEYYAGSGYFAWDLGQDLPLDNLNSNVWCKDALFTTWPQVDAIIGNPPFVAKNKMKPELGTAYTETVRSAFSEVSGHADYCVYWFRLAHDALENGQRAGFVGTNTIRQTNSRKGGLDYIVQNGGIITEAVASQVWPGDAVVHVSIVNWIKADEIAQKRRLLFRQEGNSRHGPWTKLTLPLIHPSLSGAFDVGAAEALQINESPKVFYQGQTHGHRGFLLPSEQAFEFLQSTPKAQGILVPFLTFNDFVARPSRRPSRYAIDFGERTVIEAKAHVDLFNRLQSQVLPDRKEKASAEARRNEQAQQRNPALRGNTHHQGFLQRWWTFSYGRTEMMESIRPLQRYIVCGRVTKRPIFGFVDPQIHPNDALQVFALDDDYSFGILQSHLHWLWFTERCSTLKSDPRYTSTTVFSSFPWPQGPKKADVLKVARASKALRETRARIQAETGLSLRLMYRTLDLPGKNPLKDVHKDLDSAVRKAYGFSKRQDSLEALFELNKEIRASESRGETVSGPGIPSSFENPDALRTMDRLQPLSGHGAERA